MTEHNIGDIVWLDLDKVKLIGYENRKCVDNIAKYVRAIDSGADFPPVFVAQIADNNYVLSMDESERSFLLPDNYGGHHRALAHYIAGKSLKCKITEDERTLYNINNAINIKDIVLLSKVRS